MWDKKDYEVPESQFRDRLEKVREFADVNNLSAVVAYSAPTIHHWAQSGHVGYLTNWSNLDRLADTMVVIPRTGEPVLLVAGVEYMLDQIDEVSWMSDVRLVSSPDPRAVSSSYDAGVGGQGATRGSRSFGGAVDAIIRANGCSGSPIGIAGKDQLTFSLYKDLESSVEEGIADTVDIVAELRSVKSAEENSLQRQVAGVADRCYETMLESLSDGMWGYELSAEMDRSGKRVGADFIYNTMHTAPDGDLKAGVLSIKAHDHRLNQGDYVNANAYIINKGYWIQSARSGTIGPTFPSSNAGLIQENLDIQLKVLDAIEPGLPIGELLKIAETGAERIGCTVQGGRIGHGQGLDYSEMPFLRSGSTEMLKPGHTFVLHVCLEIPGTNKLIRPIGNLCLVTEDGVEILDKFSSELFHT